MQVDLADLQLDYGKLLTQMGRPKEGDVPLKEATTLWRDLGKTFPNLPQYRKGMADAERARAVLLADLGRDQEADLLFQDAGYIRARLFNEFPDVPSYHKDLAESYHDRVQFLRRTGKLEEAKKFLRGSVDLWTNLIRVTSEPELRKQMADAVHDLGTQLRELGHAAEGEEMQRMVQAIVQAPAEQPRVANP